MIFTLLLSAESAAFAAVADVFAVGLVGNTVTSAMVQTESPEDMAKTAATICDRARWARHRALQMIQEAETLDKDVDQLKAGTEAYLKVIDDTTDLMKTQLKKWDRLFKVQLVLGILGTIVVSGVFIIQALKRGERLRGNLDAIRAARSASRQ